MDSRRVNKTYAEIGQGLINTEPELAYIKDSNVSIIYLSSDHAKKSKEKKTCAQCEKVADKYKWGIPCDFTITVFEPNVVRFTDDQIRILLFHELLHIGIEIKDNTESYYTRPHDLEDFKLIINKFGTDWDK